MTEVSSHRQILRSSSIIGGASIFNILISLLRMKVVAVLLGPAGVGLIGILQNVMNTAATISALGLGNVGTRQIAEARGKEEQAEIETARRALFWGTLILALLGALVFWLGSGLVTTYLIGVEGLSDTVSWIALGVALTVATGSQRALLTGMRCLGDIAKVSVTSSLVGAATGIAAIYWLKEGGIVLLIISPPLAGLIISQIYINRLPRVGSPAPPLSKLIIQWRMMARLGVAFMVAGLVVMLGQLVVRSMVQNELGTDSLGYFQASWAISTTYIGFVLTAMGTDYYPRLTAVIHDRNEANRLVNEQTEVAILLAGPVLLAMLSLAPWVIQLLYTDEFKPATAILRWQILGDVLKIISWPLGFIILASGKGTVFMLKEAAVIGVFVLVTWVLLPYLKVESAGVAFFVMYIVNVFILFLITYGITGFSWKNKVKRDIIILAVLALITAIAGHYSDWLGAIIGGLLTIVLGITAVIRLASMAELGGPIGKILRKF